MHEIPHDKIIAMIIILCIKCILQNNKIVFTSAYAFWVNGREMQEVECLEKNMQLDRDHT